MVFSNWFRILRIGQVTVINVMMLSQPVFPGVGPSGSEVSIKVATQSKIDISDLPVLGMYTVHSKGAIRLYCSEKNSEKLTKIIAMSSSGIVSLVDNVQFVDKKIINDEIKNNQIVPGFMEDLQNDDTVYSFKGQFESKFEKRNGNTPDIGIVFRPSCIIKKDKFSKGYLVTLNHKNFIVNRSTSNEGIHVECRNQKTNEMLSHYYYYLCYEIDKN